MCFALFPYTTLFRSGRQRGCGLRKTLGGRASAIGGTPVSLRHCPRPIGTGAWLRRLAKGSQATRGAVRAEQQRDRKSTRLNSSHVAISYAVFCVKNK